MDSSNKYIEIDNSAETTSITVTKVWDDDVPEDYITSYVSVQLYLNETLISNYDINTEYEVTLSESNNWTYTWEDLPSYIDGDVANYTVVETYIGSTGATGYGAFDEYGNWYSDDAYTQYIVETSRTTTYDDDGNITSINITVTNSIHLIKIDISKVTVLGTPLSGVEFLLQYYDDDGNLIDVATGTTSEDGTLTFADLEHGTKYVLTEISTNEDYYLLNTPIYIQIVKSGNSTDVLKIYTDETYETEASEEDFSDDGIYQYVSLSESEDSIEIINISHTALPKAGGIGTSLFYILGAIIMITSGIIIYLKRN